MDFGNATRIGVVIRMRPLLEEEEKNGHRSNHVKIDNRNKQISVQLPRAVKHFKFDHVFDGESSQEDLFQQCQVDSIMKKVIEGYNATIFAYGQTGSGKTYTMEGYDYSADSGMLKPNFMIDNSREGIIQRSVRNLFTEVQKQSLEFHIYCTFIQIYNEKIYDLLNPAQFNAAGPGLKVRWNKYDQFYVENLYMHQIGTPSEAISHFNHGIKNKVIATHNLNLASSRSHSLFTFIVEIIDPSGSITTSRLQLVDLAGSERTSMTGAEGVALKESIDINKSLFTLRQVILTLSDERQEMAHVPYRDSQLTKLLKQSIGGNSYCLMVACISPSDAFIDENMSTLSYANKTSYISNEPVKNVDPKTKVINELKAEINELKSELTKAQKNIELFQSGIQTPAVTESYAKPEIQKTDDVQVEEKFQEMTAIISDISQKPKARTKNALSPKTTPSPSGPPATTATGTTLLTPELLSEKLQDSVTMLKDAMDSNKKLRVTMNDLVQANRLLKADNNQFQVENLELLERIELLESLIPNPNPTNQNKGDMSSELNFYKTEVTKDLVHLRADRNELEKRIKQLESENTAVANTFNTASMNRSPSRRVTEEPRTTAAPTRAIFGLTNGSQTPTLESKNAPWRAKRTVMKSAGPPQRSKSSRLTPAIQKPDYQAYALPARPPLSTRPKASRGSLENYNDAYSPMQAKKQTINDLSQLLINRANYSRTLSNK